MGAEQAIIDEINKSHKRIREDVKADIDKSTGEAKTRFEKFAADILALEDDLLELKKERLKGVQTQPGQRSQEDTEFMDRYGKEWVAAVRTRDTSGLKAMRKEMQERALTLDPSMDAGAGNWIPEQLEQGIISKAVEIANMEGAVTVYSTDVPKIVRPTGPGVTVVWGGQSFPASVAKTTGKIVIDVKSVRGQAIFYNETLEDSYANIIQYFSNQYALAFTSETDRVIILGDGSDEPHGILLNSVVAANSVNSGVADALTDADNNGFDALKTMQVAIKDVYRRNGSFCMNRFTKLDLSLVKDGDGRYMMQPAVTAGEPDMLCGSPILINEHMPDADDDDKLPIIFGDFKTGYELRNRQGMTFTMLNELYAVDDQTGMIVKARKGGNVIQDEAFAVLKIGA